MCTFNQMENFSFGTEDDVMQSLRWDFFSDSFFRLALPIITFRFSLSPLYFQARQRASIRWLLSKAYSNRIPEQLQEPFYNDHDGNHHLKPQIVVGLGNASIYCQVLSNIYSDPNYQSLNHWSILQTLSRKGVPILEERAGETPLTETVLIQTNPIRIVSFRSAFLFDINLLLIVPF